MNVIELKKAIYTYLSLKSPRVFDSEAPAKVVYPYVVYSLDNSDTADNQKMEVFNLIIDIYGNNQFDFTDVDTLAGVIDGDGAIVSATGLHRKHYSASGVVTADFYRIARSTFSNDPSENIKHILLSYDVYTYLV